MTDSVQKQIGDRERRARAPDDFNHTTAADLLRATEAIDTDVLVKTIDARTRATTEMIVGKVVAPVLAGFIRELRSANTTLEKRVGDLEAKLDLAERVARIEQRLDGPANNVKRFA
jgi:hypothetical protein